MRIYEHFIGEKFIVPRVEWSRDVDFVFYAYQCGKNSKNKNIYNSIHSTQSATF